MFADGRIPRWLVATIAGLGAVAVLGIFFYGSYVGVG
ncbi:MAG: photosystem II reaction center protein J, partial [Kamptonema sp. SIO4C4]|nr:photosystem II reaction center protein J [Kamptonema sp. SIO4C4]